MINTKSVIITQFAPADYLKSDEAILAFLSEAFSSRDPQHIADAIGIVSRAKGVTAIPCKTFLEEKDNPTLQTVIAVLGALGLDLTVCAHPT